MPARLVIDTPKIHVPDIRAEMRAESERRAVAREREQKTRDMAELEQEKRRLDTLLHSFMQTVEDSTRVAYHKDMQAFARWIFDLEKGIAPTFEKTNEAMMRFLTIGQATANDLAYQYRAHMIGEGYSPSTINRRLASLRALARLGRTFGLNSWGLEVKNVRQARTMKTRHLEHAEVMRMIHATDNSRDRAMLHLLHDIALRRNEVATLRFCDFKKKGDRWALFVLWKGFDERQWIKLPNATADALLCYIADRPETAYGDKAPLFLSEAKLAPWQIGEKFLTGQTIQNIVHNAAQRAGIERKVTPHMLRHAGITRAAELLNGNVAALKAYSRHSDVRTVMIYVHEADDTQARVADKVAGGE